MKQVDKQPSTCKSALRLALTPMEPKRLPTNFAYTTMRRIHREQVEADRREHLVAIITITAVSLLGIAVFAFFFGLRIWQAFKSMFVQSEAFLLILSTLFCLTFFALLNHWLAKRQAKNYI
ncbi:MAG: hypothetical protein J6W52_10645 [Bacteroidaceae bacterium]|nr:hypothetical protein [Bacteroidaceae bacterium]